MRGVFVVATGYMAYNAWQVAIKPVMMAPGIFLPTTLWQLALSPVALFTANLLWLVILWAVLGVFLFAPWVSGLSLRRRNKT